MSSYLKYLKYKTKYIELKKIYNGGGEKTARNYFIRNLLNNPDMFTIFRENLQSDIDNELINTGVVINKENLELLFNSFYHKLLEKNTTNLKTDRYIDFFIKSYLNNKFGEGKSSIQNMDRFIDYIQDHDILKNRFPQNTPPLETFNDDLIELEKFLKPLKPEIEKIKLSKLGKKVGKMEPIFETEDVLVYNPKTMEQSIAYGMQTKWCTASTNLDNNMFNKYKDQGEIYIFISKINPKIKFQLQFESNQLMDAVDKITYFDDIPPEFTNKKILDFLKQVILNKPELAVEFPQNKPNEIIINTNGLLLSLPNYYEIMRELLNNIYKTKRITTIMLNMNVQIEDLLYESPQIEKLHFGESFNKPLGDSLSHLTNLKTLMFGSYFNQPLGNSLSQLKSLKTLIFGNKFDQPLRDSLSQLINLEMLMFDINFNQPFGDSLSNLIKLKNIYLTDNYKHPIDRTLLPPNVNINM